jgi:hypothetical protein
VVVQKGLKRVLRNPAVPLLVKLAGFHPRPNARPPDVQLRRNLAHAVSVLEPSRNAAARQHFPNRFFRTLQVPGDFLHAHVVNGLNGEAEFGHCPTPPITDGFGGQSQFVSPSQN